ncbi:MAG TPA: hypothetical protein PKA53_13290 [Sphingobacterium sp.]|nr:hypothetical protein [Sphingobacterium sp.]
MVGPVVNLPFDHTGAFSLELKGVVGIPQSYSPEVNLWLLDNNPKFSSRQESASASSLSYLGGMGFKYRIIPKFALTFTVDFNSSNPEYDHITGHVGGIPFSRSRKHELSTPSIDTGLGINITF